MYLSHTVRSIRADPQADESVGLVVEVDADASTVAESSSSSSDAASESDGAPESVPASGSGREESRAASPPAALAEVVAEYDGTIERDLGFDAWLVVVPESAIDALCELEDVVRIETDATISLQVETLSAEAKAALDAAATDDSPSVGNSQSDDDSTSADDSRDRR